MLSRKFIACISAGLLALGALPVASQAAYHRHTTPTRLAATQEKKEARTPAQKQTLVHQRSATARTAMKHRPLKQATVRRYSAQAARKTVHSAKLPPRQLKRTVHHSTARSAKMTSVRPHARTLIKSRIATKQAAMKKPLQHLARRTSR